MKPYIKSQQQLLQHAIQELDFQPHKGQTDTYYSRQLQAQLHVEEGYLQFEFEEAPPERPGGYSQRSRGCEDLLRLVSSMYDLTELNLGWMYCCADPSMMVIMSTHSVKILFMEKGTLGVAKVTGNEHGAEMTIVDY